MTDEIACAHCGNMFLPSREGHTYCKPECRYGGPVAPALRRTPDADVISRLFDPTRDPAEQARADDWHPDPPDSPFRALETHDTVADRRRWFMRLRELRRLR